MSGHPSGARLADLRPGAIVLVDGCASAQFSASRALTLRLVSVSDRPTYQGWVWVTGYVLDSRGDATAKREVFVRTAGLHLQRPAPVLARRGTARV